MIIKIDQFDTAQLKEIKKGLDNNLDISIYAKPEFHSDKMGKIRLALKKNLNIKAILKEKDIKEYLLQIKHPKYQFI